MIGHRAYDNRLLSSLSVSLRGLFEARQLIGPWVQRTPLRRCNSLSAVCGANVYLKLETEQEIGAFKIRGATNRLLRLSEEERSRGVVTVSTGNHGRAVAQAASRAGVSAVVCTGLYPRRVARRSRG